MTAVPSEADIIRAAAGADERVAVVKTLSHLVYLDAERHGLYEEYYSCEDIIQCRRAMAQRIGLEVQELIEAAGNGSDYTRELADVVIMACSVAGYLGIDIGAAVQDKRLENIERPYRHEK